MNHRDLVLSARKKARFAFLALPEDLQDEVVDGLDGQTLTLEGASALIKSRGHSLSHEAVAGYYRAVRIERRLLETNQELTRIVREFSNKSYEENLRALVNVIIATAATGLADGSVGIKDVDLGKVLKALPQNRNSDQVEKAEEPKKGQGLTAKAAEEIRTKILGITK